MERTWRGENVGSMSRVRLSMLGVASASAEEGKRGAAAAAARILSDRSSSGLDALQMSRPPARRTIYLCRGEEAQLALL